MSIRPACSLLLVIGVAACDRTPEPGTPPPRQVAGTFAAEHAFGWIPHGESRRAEVDIPLPDEGGPWIPIGFQRTCTCARHEFLITAPDGTERTAPGIGSPDPGDAVPLGGRLRLRVTIDTREKEAADLEPVWTAGQVILQDTSPRARREVLPVRFSFGVRAPLRLVPYAHLDVGRLPRATSYRQTLEIHRRDLPCEFGTPRCVEAVGAGAIEATDVRAQLEPTDFGGLLHVELSPAEHRPDGPFVVEIRVPTTLPGDYELRVPVSGEVVPDVVVSPPGWLSFGPFPFGQARECAVMITDHDTGRPADWHIASILDRNGNDLGEHFRARIDPVASLPRCRTLHLDYLGTLDARSFRGEVHLAKDAGSSATLHVEFAGFDRR